MRNARCLMTAAAATLLGAGLAMADPPAGDPPGRGRRGGPGGAAWAGARLESLNLSADQKEQIRILQQQNREAIAAALARQREAREAVEAQVQAAVFNEQALREACRKAAAAHEEVAVLRARQASQMRALLTADQQAAFDKQRADTRGRMRDRMAPWRDRAAERREPNAPKTTD